MLRISMRKYVPRAWILGLLLLVLGAQAPAGAAALDIPPNRWVPIEFKCEGGLKSYFRGCPSGRGWLQIAYDTKRHAVVLFGGSGEWYFNDLWRFDPKTRVWTLIIQDTRLLGEERDWKRYPKGRDNHQLVYDPRHDVYWMYGGTGGAGFWRFLPKENTWERIPGGHDGQRMPQAALDPGFAYSADHDAILLFGGERNRFWEETWVFDTKGEKWRRIRTQPAPSARAQIENAMVYDARNKVFVLFGGRSPLRERLNDTWVFDLEKQKWEQRTPSVAPSGRDQHIMAYDEAHGLILLWGGTNKADTWVYDTKADRWTEVKSARGSYRPDLARKAAGVYVPDLGATLYRDLQGNMYLFRLDPARIEGLSAYARKGETAE